MWVGKDNGDTCIEQQNQEKHTSKILAQIYAQLLALDTETKLAQRHGEMSNLACFRATFRKDSSSYFQTQQWAVDYQCSRRWIKLQPNDEVVYVIETSLQGLARSNAYVFAQLTHFVEECKGMKNDEQYR